VQVLCGYTPLYRPKVSDTRQRGPASGATAEPLEQFVFTFGGASYTLSAESEAFAEQDGLTVSGSAVRPATLR
jgi:hypothetical protein